MIRDGALQNPIVERMAALHVFPDMEVGNVGFKEGIYIGDDIETAYKALGISADATDKEVKRAYRKLMSENHPDKLIAQGVPDSVIQLANEKSAEISTAYELITKVRRGQ